MNIEEKVLITGIKGFIGSALSEYLVKGDNISVFGTSRSIQSESDQNNIFTIKNLSANTDWSSALHEIDTVVHTAARVHVLKEHSDNPREDFLSVNTDATLNLAKQAIAAGVKKFIFLSSIGVNGTITINTPFNEEMEVFPTSHYAESKFLAEKSLLELTLNSPMDVVIVRPPLVYGINAPGNFGALLKIISKNIPLPFSLTKNKRSFISIENLVHFLSVCIADKRAANEIFVISDGHDLSTPELIQILARGMRKKPLLFPCPDLLLKLGARLTNRLNQYQQLCGSMQIDISKANKLLNWKPIISSQLSLTQLAEKYHDKNL